jgi:hypothetical protein
VAKKPQPPTWEEVYGQADEPTVAPYSTSEARNIAFRPHWVQRTLRDMLYEILVKHWRAHGTNPTGLELARQTDRPYTSVRSALVELRAEGRLIHRGRGINIPVECFVPEK